MPARYVHKQSGTANFGQVPTAADLIFDTADSFLKYGNSTSARTVVNAEEAQTISGAKTFTGAITTTATGAEQSAVVTLTNAEMLALRATPKQLVAAPGAGFALIFTGGHITIDYTGAYTESADNLAVRYTNGSGVQVSTIEATGFLDATADSVMTMAPIAPTTAPVAVNAALVLHNTGDGEWGGGNAANVITVTTRYRVVAVP
jgi:hypothetical protein